ncbi:hypothetical protein G9A89_002677 [Geosiphon pyriformis]|nr:hypothetical protein G9A89_002677 [Geosiphon pyriformis]
MCIKDEDNESLARFLSLRDDSATSLARYLENGNGRQALEETRHYLRSPWDEIVNMHFKVLLSSQKHDFVNAFETQHSLVHFFLKEAFTHLTLPILYTVNWDLRHLAMEADDELKRALKSPKYLEEAGRVLNKSFSVCVTDRAPKNASRQWGTYYIANLLIKTQFKLGQENLCKNVLRGIESSDIPNLKSFPKAHQITFKYYRGLLCFFDQQYRQAEEYLEYAFRICPKSYKRNKELILRYLIPVWLIRGVLPSKALIERYPRLKALYSPFINAIRIGNVKAFDIAFANAEHRLVEQGTFLTVEMARAISLKTLFKKVWLINNKTNKIPMIQFQIALKYVGIEADMAEVAWSLAVMIQKGLIRGYLSEAKLFVVFSTKDAFPVKSSN